jgi:signal transduction histidine kinase
MRNRILYIALAFSIILMVSLGKIYLGQNSLQLRYTGEVEHTYQLIITLKNCGQFLSDAETSHRGYLLSHDQHFKAPYLEAVSRTDSTLSRIKTLSADNPTQRVNMKLLDKSVQQLIGMLNQSVESTRRTPGFILQLQQEELVMDKVRLYIKEMENVEYDLLRYRNREKDHYQQLNLIFLKYTATFGLLIFLLSIIMIIRELRERVRTQKMLEKSVFELKRSNDEIEQVSYAASHDLQEPIRKIRTFSTLLLKRYDGRLNSEEKDIVERLEKASERMHALLANLVNFTSLANTDERPKMVDLDLVFTRVIEMVMAETEMFLNKPEPLPEVKGYEQQIKLLFTQLLSNSLKYKHPDRALIIDIRSDVREQKGHRKWFWQRIAKTRYHVITMTDNGIGFDSSFNEKIFQLFQRLHNQTEYSGQGIGLTIARRIMTNHYGFIYATGNKGKGAVIMLWFPAA